jgi:hypothetical protein
MQKTAIRMILLYFCPPIQILRPLRYHRKRKRQEEHSMPKSIVNYTRSIEDNNLGQKK